MADPAAIAVHVERARDLLSAAFATIFDGALVGAHERLVAEPGNAGAKVEFVTVYHMVIEGTLGLTAFNFITRYLERSEQLPGFVAGYSKIHHDEQRHIAYGTWFLREAVRARPELADNVRGILRSLLPAAAEALAPPDRDGTDWEALGAGADEIREFAVSGLAARLPVTTVTRVRRRLTVYPASLMRGSSSAISTSVTALITTTKKEPNITMTSTGGTSSWPID